jgi:hypothetical protein
MSRKPRSFAPDIPYHLMNRATARAKIFHKQADCEAFEKVLEQAVSLLNLRLLASIVMPKTGQGGKTGRSNVFFNASPPASARSKHTSPPIAETKASTKTR